MEKDGGDDSDVTFGVLIVVRAERSAEPGICILGGEGIGRVARPGLGQPIGEATINRIPRKMIQEQVQRVCQEAAYGHSTAAVFRPFGEVVELPFEVRHTPDALMALAEQLKGYEGETRVILEHTGRYDVVQL